VNDRLGRTGLMFSAVGSYAPGYDPNDRYTYRHSFIFDASTGHLNAYEEVAGEDIDYFVPGGTLHSVTVGSPYRPRPSARRQTQAAAGVQSS
jgi:hypothetical protein